MRAPTAPARRLAAVALELLLAVALALGCFSCFLVLLDVAFPKGQTLHALLADRVETWPRQPDRVEVAPVVKSVASLSVLRRSVRSRPAGAITWSSAASGLALHDGDGVQTGTEGRAQLSFGEALRIELERNSLVVVSDPQEGATATGTSAQRSRGVIMAEGELWARLRSGTQEPLAITLPSATAALGGGAGRSATEMQVTVRRDGRSTLAVHEGQIALQGSGPALDFGPGQYVRVASDGTVSAPMPLPSAPAVDDPGPGAAFGYLDLPPRIPFRWRTIEGAAQYRLRAARDPEFQDVVLDETVAQPSLTWGRMEPGTYYWRVTAIVDNIDGMPSPARSLVVSRDHGQLQLKVATPKVANLRCVVRGRATKRANIFVVGRRVDMQRDGTFETEVELEPGANVLLVEAVDAAGHSTYWSQVVHGKP
ncbi:MAG TPA: FecR domain-containing protein [Candidatus Limnocylindria bacterium]|nr:FecR domain-containing protein [Candidatus Limnocylindria bacterium]